MATQAAYRPYKRETSRLVKWIIERFRGLSKCCEHATPKSQDLSARITATGEVKACMIPEMCQFIALATRVDSVPSDIFTLFEYVIRALEKGKQVLERGCQQVPSSMSWSRRLRHWEAVCGEKSVGPAFSVSETTIRVGRR